MEVYTDLNVRKVINAEGQMTHLGGSRPDPIIFDYMKDASRNFVVMMELIEKSGKYIADITGSEDALITSGASSALVLAAAACMMKGTKLENYDIKPYERIGLDEEWRSITQQLPNHPPTRNKFIILSSHRSPYDHAFQVAGGEFIEIDDENDDLTNNIIKAIDENTAGIVYYAHKEKQGVSFKEIIRISKEHGVPLIVDAAPELPPKVNLRRYIREGADLVIFSGGKMIAGPNDTGILCGNGTLVKLAKLQAPPYRGIGRGMKVDRTQIIGLIKALELYLNKDDEVEFNKNYGKAEIILAELKKNECLDDVRIVSSKDGIISDRINYWVHVRVKIKKSIIVSNSDFVIYLRKRDPSIWVKYVDEDTFDIDTTHIYYDDISILLYALENAFNEFQKVVR